MNTETCRTGRSCIRPFIKQAQAAFRAGSTLDEVRSTIPAYQQRIDNGVRRINPAALPLHKIAMSGAFLTGVAIWEYSRVAHGAPLPDLGHIVSLLPVASMSDCTDSFKTPQPTSDLTIEQIRDRENQRMQGFVDSQEAVERPWDDNFWGPKKYTQGGQAERNVFSPELQSGHERGYKRRTPDDDVDTAATYMDLVRAKNDLDKDLKSGRVSAQDYTILRRELNDQERRIK